MRKRKLMKITGTILALLLLAPSAGFALGLEKAGIIIPTGMDTGFLNPEGLWHDPLKGLLVVANTQAQRVAVLNRSGQALKVLGKKGGLGFPVAVAGKREGTLYIAERGSESLKVLPWYDSATMEEYRGLDLEPYRRSSPVQPVALFIDGDGNLYVADRGNRQILVFDKEEKFRHALPDVGEPADIWVEPSGKILVADPAFGGIRGYTSPGTWQRTIGGSSAQFREPLRVKAMVVDRRGRIWIVEEGGQRIKCLDSLGNLLFSQEIGLFTPVDLAIDDHDNLFVLEQGGNRILEFRIIEF